MTELLNNVYDQESFRKTGHLLVDLIADHLRDSSDQTNSVNRYIDPDVQLAFWRNYKIEKDGIGVFFSKLIDDSIHLHHPKYMGHQISPPAPIAAISAMLTDILNNGMGVYEMGGPSTSIEQVVIETISSAIGYGPNAGGFLTSGGTLANLTALLTARSQFQGRHIWNNGNGDRKLAIMVSEQAHYCVDRAARIMGLGSEGIIKIPVNNDFQIRTDLLDKNYEMALANGREIFAIVGCACTTSTGSYDGLSAIGDFALKRNIWFHVDGAHGGAVVFSKKYKHLVKGIIKADSVIIDCHKMMMTPSLTTALVYKDNNHSYATFSQDANYLFEKDQDKEWYNLAKRTFECTKLMMGVKFYSIIQAHGIEAIDDFVTTLHDNARLFADLIHNEDCFELAQYPESNIVCYRYFQKDVSEVNLNAINSDIRKKIFLKGEFYIVHTVLNNKVYLRNTMMNPFTTKKEMDSLIKEIKDILRIKNLK